MTPKDWLYIVGILVGGFWGVIVAQRKDIERLVGKRLDDIQRSISGLTETVTAHGQQLTRHETVLEMNGLLERRERIR